MPNDSTVKRLKAMPMSRVYPLYVAKVTKKGRSSEDVDTVICWFTGYDAAELRSQLARAINMQAFFEEAPLMNPHADLITGVVCGVRVENIEDPFMRRIRQLDKLVDELARGKALEKILRS